MESVSNALLPTSGKHTRPHSPPPNSIPQPGALTPAETCEAMGLPALRGRKWHVQGAISTRGEGLYEGLDWLSNTLKSMQV